MTTWVSIQDVPRAQDVTQQEETVEAKIYALRSSYHKALILQQESISVGDEKWRESQASLANLISRIETLPELSNLALSSHGLRANAGAAAGSATTESQSQSMSSFTADCQQIRYLALKNLSRMLYKGPLYSSMCAGGRAIRAEALRVALQAVASMADSGHDDPGLLLRTAMMSRAEGDIWTSRQLLGLPLGPVYSSWVRAQTNNMHMVIPCGFGSHPQPGAPPSLQLQSCWELLLPSAAAAERAVGGGSGGGSGGLLPPPCPPCSVVVGAVTRSLAAACNAQSGVELDLLQCMRLSLRDAASPGRPEGDGDGEQRARTRTEKGSSERSESPPPSREERGGEGAPRSALREGSRAETGGNFVVDLTASGSSDGGSYEGGSEGVVPDSGRGKRARPDEDCGRSTAKRAHADHADGDVGDEAGMNGAEILNAVTETETEAGTGIGPSVTASMNARQVDTQQHSVASGAVPARAATRAATRAASRSLPPQALSSASNREGLGLVANAGGVAAAGAGGSDAEGEMWAALDELLRSGVAEFNGDGDEVNLPSLDELLLRCAHSSSSIARRARELSDRQLPLAGSGTTPVAVDLRTQGAACPEVASARLHRGVFGCGAADAHAALLLYIRAVSSAVLSTLFSACATTPLPSSASLCTDGAISAPAVATVDASSLGGASLSLAVVNAWRALAAGANFHLEALVRLLDGEEQVLLAECCAECVRVARVADGGASPALADLCHATLRVLMLQWVAAVPEEALEPGSTRALTLRARRLWLLATHLLADGQRAEGVGAVVLDPLEGAIRACAPMRLVHCSGWSEVNTSACRLLRAALLDDGSARSLVHLHAAGATPEWLQAALTVLRADVDLVGTTATAARRCGSVEHWLPFLALRACAALGCWHEWVSLCTRVAEVALPAALSLLEPGSDAYDASLDWVRRVLAACATTVPNKTQLRDASMGPEWQVFANDLVLSLAGLSLQVFRQGMHFVFEAASACLVRSCFGIGTGLCIAIECLGACMTDLLLRPVGRVALVGPTARLALLLAEVGAISVAAPCAAATLTLLARTSYAFSAVWSPSSPLVLLASATVCLFAGCALPATKLRDRLDALTAYHAFACDENLWTADGGHTLLFVSRALQIAVEGGETQAQAEWGESPGGLSAAFPNKELSIGQQSELGSVLGEIFWLLYSFPLCHFTYTDGRAEVRFAFDLDAATVAALYRFYLTCVSIGLGHKIERRASLLMLTRAAPALHAVRESYGFGKLAQFVFSDSVAAASRGEAAALLAAVEQRQQEVAEDLGPLRGVVASLFFDRAAYLSDSTRDVPALDEAGEQLPAGERWQVHAIDLCLRDLAFNPTRTETWGVLYFRLSEYLLSLTDELGEACVSAALPAEWHLLLAPSDASFEGLRSGAMRLRKTFDADSLAVNFFLTHGGRALGGCSESLATAAATAWGLPSAHARGGSESLLAAVSFKNFVSRSLQRVVAAMNASMLLRDPSPAARQVHGAALLTHARVLLTLATELPEASRGNHERRSEALRSLLEAKASGATGCYLHAMEARLYWKVRGNPLLCVDALNALRRCVLQEFSSSLGKSARLCAISDASSVIGELATSFLLREMESEDEDGAAVSGEAESVAESLARVSQYDHKFTCADSAIPVPAEGSNSCLRTRNLLWLSIVNCVANFRECRLRDPHDFRCVRGLAQLIRGLTSCAAPPTWVVEHLARMDVPELSVSVAFTEIYRLFAKRVPQLVAVWSQGKAAHEWDLELQRIYNFEALRRRNAQLFLVLAEECGHLRPALDLLRDALSVPSKKQTATVRWIVDRAVYCVAGIVLHKPHTPQEATALLRAVFEIFQTAHNRVAERTFYRLQRSLVRLHCLRADSGSAAPGASRSLSVCLKACFSEFGGRASAAPFTFHRALTSGSSVNVVAASSSTLLLISNSASDVLPLVAEAEAEGEGEQDDMEVSPSTGGPPGLAETILVK